MSTQSWINVLLGQIVLLSPLLASTLYMVLVTRWAHACYSRVNQRTHPPSTYEERREYRLYFRIAFVSGLLFIALSLGWWLVTQRNQQYVFQGSIIGMDNSQQLVPREDGFYHRSIQRDVGKGRTVTDYSFSIVRNAPFYDGQTFSLGFYPVPGILGKVPPEPIELTIPFRGINNERLTLRRDGEIYRLIPAGEVVQ